MKRKLKIEIIKRLVSKGLIFEAEVFCDLHGLSRDLIKGVKND